jgi:phosphomannomutase/phosphoglucomutase
VNEGIFREYDIRGVVGKDFDASFACRLGAVLAEALFTGVFGEREASPTVVVGNDCRLSAAEITGAFVEGLLSRGANVVRTGMGPTPQLYFHAVTKKYSAGVQVTASHNPSDQNGFKMMVGSRSLSGPDIQYLKNQIKIGELPPADRARGKLDEIDGRTPYLQHLVSLFTPRMGSRKIKVVCDGGNGVGGLVGPALLKALGCEVVEIYTDPDGRFPNHHPDPTVLENIVELRKRVVAEKADCGVAWDGDADRIGVVDEKGEPIYGDMLLVIFSRALLVEAPGATILGDVKCSEHLFEDIRRHGGNPVISKTGHSIMKTRMKELKADLAGEMSGHMFFSRGYLGFDDAIYAAALVAEILSKTEKSISGLLDGIPKSFSTPELRVAVPEELKFKVAERAQSAFPEYESLTIDGVRVKFQHGWGLVRASNTSPYLIMRFEATSPELLSEYQTLVESRIEKIRQELS